MKPQTIILVIAALLVGMLIGGAFCGDSDQKRTATSSNAKVELWTCPMHPQVEQNEPGLCPICSMELVPKKSETGVGLTLKRNEARAAGIRTTVVTRAGATGTRTLIGEVRPDQSRRKAITSWVGGRVERLAVRTTGEVVKKGQVVATMYSPEIYAAHKDLLAALALKESEPSLGNSAVSAIREKLRLLGVRARDLKRMERANAPWDSIRIRAPYGGTITKMVVTDGDFVRPGSTIYEVADLSQVWVVLDAYESDLFIVKLGMTVKLRFAAAGIDDRQGKIVFIDPTLDAKTRTAKVRIEVDNSDRKLKPGMFAEAQLTTEASDRIVVPETAILYGGKRSLVFVEQKEGNVRSFVPTVVRTGARLGSQVEILSGLSEGDRIVVAGAFLLDAELQIRGGRSLLSLPDDSDPPSKVLDATPEQKRVLGYWLHAVMKLSEALAQDNFADAQRVAKEAAAAAKGQLPKDVRHLPMAIEKVTTAADIDLAREQLTTIAQVVSDILSSYGNVTEQDVYWAYCPMARDNQGGYWLQGVETIKNPYFGEKMHSCGEVKQTVSPGERLPETVRVKSTMSAPGHIH